METVKVLAVAAILAIVVLLVFALNRPRTGERRQPDPDPQPDPTPDPRRASWARTSKLLQYVDEAQAVILQRANPAAPEAYRGQPLPPDRTAETLAEAQRLIAPHRDSFSEPFRTAFHAYVEKAQGSAGLITEYAGAEEDARIPFEQLRDAVFEAGGLYIKLQKAAAAEFRGTHD